MTTTAHRTRTPLHARLAHALLTASLLLGGSALAQTPPTPGPDPAVLAMLARAQPGSMYTMPGTLWEVCSRLAQAGLVEQGVGFPPRSQVEHLFYDAVHRQYLSVLEGERTVIRVTSGIPAAREWIWME